MSEIILECAGLPCPQPVLQCKKTIEESAPVTLKIVVDNEPAVENVTRFLKNKGYAVNLTTSGDTYTLSAIREGESCEECQVMTDEAIMDIAASKQKITVFITSDVVGSGDDTLGGKLMVNFLATLPELGDELWRIVMVNGGVKLACEGHACLEKLVELEQSGVSMLVCGTCLDHFNLLDKKKVGETTNMLDVVTSLQVASKIIQP